MGPIIAISRRGVLAGAAGLAACAPRAGKPADLTLRVGSYKGGVQTLFAAAGLTDTPYKIRYSELGAGNLIGEAINARALDVGSMSEIPPIFIAGKAPLLRLIAVQKGDVNAQVVLVPAASPIRSPADLKGKRIGFVKATTAHYLLLRMLAEHGLTFADIEPIALSPQDGLAAFGRGALDAWVIYGVQGSIARGRLGARVLTTGLGRLSGNYVYAALNEALDDPPRRAAIVDYLRRTQRAYAWADKNPAAWADAQSKATGVPAAIYLQQNRERSAPTLLAPVEDGAIASEQAVADTFAKAGVIPAVVDVRPLWTTTLNKELAKSI
jgi:sulfonate transport system substrate-binding protein